MENGNEILKNIEENVKKFRAPEAVLALYHGSKTGIRGKVVHDYCDSDPDGDFGKGFYLGSSRDQAASLVFENPSSVLYTFEVDFRPLDCVILEKNAWLYYICWNRGWICGKAEECLSRIFSPLSEMDVIIGEIADDRMQKAVSEFVKDRITDAALSMCMKSAKLGVQYVLKTKKACDNIRLVKKSTPTFEERKRILNRTTQRWRENMEILERTRKAQMRSGMYFFEIQEAIEEMCDADQCHPIHL